MNHSKPHTGIPLVLKRLPWAPVEKGDDRRYIREQEGRGVSPSLPLRSLTEEVVKQQLDDLQNQDQKG
jgi:hypothetical protein